MQESSDGVNYSVSDQGRHFIWLLFHDCPRFLRKASWTISTSGPCHGEGDAGGGENAEKHAAFKCKSGVKRKREGSLETEVLEVWSGDGRAPSFLSRNKVSRSLSPGETVVLGTTPSETKIGKRILFISTCKKLNPRLRVRLKAASVYFTARRTLEYFLYFPSLQISISLQ